jgi:hypothetical protein
MAGDWMKVEKVTPRKPEILEMAAILGLSADDVFGKLFRLWAWADDHTQDGNARGVTFALADSEIGVTGFADAMHEVGWLERIEPCQDFPRGGVCFVNFTRHNGQTAKSRALTASRVAKCKAKAKDDGNANGNGPSVTDALAREEKRREEVNTHTHAPARTREEQAGSAPLKTWDAPAGADPIVIAAVDDWQAYRLSVDGRHDSGVRIDALIAEATRKGWAAAKIAASVQFSIAKGAKSWIDSDLDFEQQRKQTQTAKSDRKPTWAERHAMASEGDPF